MRKIFFTLAFALALCAPIAAQTPARVNVLQTDDVSIVASSTYSNLFPAVSAANADTTGRKWGTGDPGFGGWNSGTAERTTEGGAPTLDLFLSRRYSLTQIEVYGLREAVVNNPSLPAAEPTDAEVSMYANKDFDIYVSGNGGVDWKLVGVFRGNQLVKNVKTFDTPQFVDAVRVKGLASGDGSGFIRVVEVRALARQ